MTEKSPLGAVLVGAGAVVAIVTVAALAIGAGQYAGFLLEDERREKVLGRPSPLLPEVRAREASELSGYRWIDRKAGVVGLPIDRAIALTLADRRPR